MKTRGGYLTCEQAGQQIHGIDCACMPLYDPEANRYVFASFRNGGRRCIRPGDWVLFKPRVRRSLFIGIRATKPFATASKHFAGLAVDTFRQGESGRVQVYGVFQVVGSRSTGFSGRRVDK